MINKDLKEKIEKIIQDKSWPEDTRAIAPLLSDQILSLIYKHLEKRIDKEMGKYDHITNNANIYDEALSEIKQLLKEELLGGEKK